MDPSLVRISKFISLVLRHNPGRIGLKLDANGWAEVDELLLKAGQSGLRIERQTLEQVVAGNNKQRFAFSPDGTKIRASQGHSIPVDLELQPVPPPEVLYHGSARQAEQSILEKGLLPGKRNHVHLSADLQTALTVGRRHGKPVVFLVRAGKMEADGHAFYLSANGVWLTERVPVQYLELMNE